MARLVSGVQAYGSALAPHCRLEKAQEKAGRCQSYALAFWFSKHTVNCDVKKSALAGLNAPSKTNVEVKATKQEQGTVSDGLCRYQDSSKMDINAKLTNVRRLCQLFDRHKPLFYKKYLTKERGELP